VQVCALQEKRRSGKKELKKGGITKLCRFMDPNLHIRFKKSTRFLWGFSPFSSIFLLKQRYFEGFSLFPEKSHSTTFDFCAYVSQLK
jgi:hypothetical protein